MPTTRPRLTITETDELAAILDAAAARWPEIGSRRELLLRLVAGGPRRPRARARRCDNAPGVTPCGARAARSPALTSPATSSGCATTGRRDRRRRERADRAPRHATPIPLASRRASSSPPPSSRSGAVRSPWPRCSSGRPGTVASTAARPRSPTSASARSRSATMRGPAGRTTCRDRAEAARLLRAARCRGRPGRGGADVRRSPRPGRRAARPARRLILQPSKYIGNSYGCGRIFTRSDCSRRNSM